MANPFYKNNGPLKISYIIELLDLNQDIITNDQEILDIKDLFTSNVNEITFFHSKKYKDLAKNTKASLSILNSQVAEIVLLSSLVFSVIS